MVEWKCQEKEENILESPVKCLGLIVAFPLTALKETLSTKKQIWVSIYCMLGFFTSTGCLFCLAAIDEFPREMAAVQDAVLTQLFKKVQISLFKMYSAAICSI